MNLNIEIAVSEGVSTTEQGRLLESLGSEVLKIMQYDVLDEVRLTGIEVDLMAKHKISGEKIYVECKAHKNNLSADVITKLLGNVTIKGVSSGWLFSTAKFGKDAKGLADEWQEKSFEIRGKMHLYTPENLITLLIDSCFIVDPMIIKAKYNQHNFQDAYLLITNMGNYWCFPISDEQTGLQVSVVSYNAKDGSSIVGKEKLRKLSETNSTLKDLHWILENDSLNQISCKTLEIELQSIVKVPTADSWDDYRPARPKDYVGRDELQSRVFNFFDEVREGKSETRVMALKSPSGWGKSSTILKFIEKSRNIRNKKKYYVYGVDCRAAISHRYGELAMVHCFNQAIADGFAKTSIEKIKIGSVTNPFSDESMSCLLNALKVDNKVIVLLFDQFEEIFSKQDLSQLFNELSSLCSSVDSAQENVVLGFSWKTDGTIPQDHPAYHMWQSLADRRKEFSLVPFTSKEVSKGLGIFEKQLGEPLNPQVRRLLTDQCQGYPWLLKKLCIHIHRLVREGADQVDIINEAFNVKELFEDELKELSGREVACVKMIANESPVEYFIVEEKYGAEVIAILQNKRIVLRSGSRLILYWDIFRDYVISGKVPNIPISYIPQSEVARYVSATLILLENKKVDFHDLSKRLGLTLKTSDNLIRDLVMVGNASSNRKQEIVMSLSSNEVEAVSTIVRYCRCHYVILRLIEEKGQNFSVTVSEFKKCLKSIYSDSDFYESTWNIYVNRLISWFIGFGILKPFGTKFIYVSENILEKLPKNTGRRSKFSSGIYFLGDAPPERVIESFHSFCYDRNTKCVLKNLCIMDKKTEKLLQIPSNHQNYEEWLRQKVLDALTIKIVSKLLDENSTLSGKNIGSALKEELNTSWSDGSLLRYGGALKRWANWANSQY